MQGDTEHILCPILCPIMGAGGENHGFITIGLYHPCKQAGELVTARANGKVLPGQRRA